ncbi:MAG: AEC family transporter, partial [Candidatus Krumholzibacteriaceae bacterium]
YLHALPSAPFMKMIDMLGEASIPTGLMLLGMQLESIVLESSAWRATLAGAVHGEFRIGDEHNGEVSEGVCETPYTAAIELKRDISGGLASAALKILGGFAASYGLIQLFHFNANMNQVIVVQSAMPTAVNAIVFATEFNCRPRLVAVGILASTLASVVSITLILRYVGF